MVEKSVGKKTRTHQLRVVQLELALYLKECVTPYWARTTKMKVPKIISGEWVWMCLGPHVPIATKVLRALGPMDFGEWSAHWPMRS